jgi:acetyl esterase
VRHPDNSNWLSLLAGQPIQVAPVRSFDDIFAMRAGDRSHLNRNLPDLAALNEGVVLWERDGGALAAEICVPNGEPPFPALLWLHGGGWVAGSAEGTRRITTKIAAAGYVVVGLDYGLGPERPFPGGLEDCVYAARWIVENIGRYGGAAGPLAIGGDSAGANLAAATISYLSGGSGCDLGDGDLAHVGVVFSAALLLHGIFDFPLLVREPGTHADLVEVAYSLAYLGPDFRGLYRHPLVSPILAPNLNRFPPTYLGCGDEDSLLGQTLAMTKALADAGVSATLSVVSGCDHAFALLTEHWRNAGPEVDRMLAWLRTEARSAGADASAASATA